MTVTCADCRFWRPTSDTPDTGKCRRRAPTVNGFSSRWATTRHDDWCGEFEARQTSPKPE